MNKPPSRFQIINASAGSGKTSAIAKAYLYRLLSSKDKYPFKKQLALTFTNKAVNEMKTRILDHLAEFAAGQKLDGYVAKDLCNWLNINPSGLKYKSENILKGILKDYGSFQVITLDKFTNRIVKIFSRDLKLPQNFNIELDSKKMFSDIVDEMVWEVYKDADNDLTKKFRFYCQELSTRNESWDQLTPIKNLCNEIYSENDYQYIDKLKSISEDDLTEIEKKLTENRKVLQENMIRLIDQIVIYLRNETFTLKPHQLKYCVDSFDVKKRELIRAKSSNVKYFLPLRRYKELSGSSEFLGLFDEFKCLALFFTLHNKILKNWGPFSMLQLLAKTIREFQHTEGTMLLGELNQKVSQVVKNSPTPFIYERFGEKYKHYFIDEFQDTSVMQWNNLIPLIENSLEPQDDQYNDSEQHDNHDGSLLLVGDPKQAIYGWRGGKSEQLIDMAEKKVKPFKEEQKVDNLETNFRSADQIIKFNNAMYKLASEIFLDPHFKSVYAEGYEMSGATQKYNDKKGGYICAELIRPTKGKSQKGSESTTKYHGNSSKAKSIEDQPQNLKNYTLVDSEIGFSKSDDDQKTDNSGPSCSQSSTDTSDIPSQIKRLELEENQYEGNNIDPLCIIKTAKAIYQSRQQGYGFSEIAVLIRTNLQSTKIAQKLSDYGIPFISEGSLKLENSSEVLFIIDLCELLVSENERTIHKKIAEKLWYHLMSETQEVEYHEFVTKLIDHTSDEPEPNVQWGRLSSQEFFKRIKSQCGFNFSWYEFKYLGLYESIEYAISKFDFLHSQNPALAYFLEDVFEFSANNDVSIYEYLDHWEFKKSELSFEPNVQTDSVTLLTIHKAKGLEFPVVIIPFCTHSFFPQTNSSAWSPVDSDQNLDISLDKVWLPVSQDLENFQLFKVKSPYKSNYAINSISSFYKDLNSKTLNEEMNNFYVGTTRAVEALFLFTKFIPEANLESDDRKPSLEWLINIFFRQSNEFSHVARENADIYEIGMLKKITKEGAEDKESVVWQPQVNPIEININTSLKWRDRIAHQTDSKSIASIESGNILHQILQDIIGPQDIDKAIEANKEWFVDNRKLEHQTREVVKKIVNHHELSSFFLQDSSKVLCEVGILDRDKRIKPDRVVEFDEKIVVIDYKTGKAIKSHQEQIESYGHKLERMFCRPVEKYLVYIDLKKERVDVEKVQSSTT